MMQQFIQTFDYATSISNFIDFAYDPRELLRFLQNFEDPERSEQTLITPSDINQLLQQMVAFEL